MDNEQNEKVLLVQKVSKYSGKFWVNDSEGKPLFTLKLASYNYLMVIMGLFKYQKADLYFKDKKIGCLTNTFLKKKFEIEDNIWNNLSEEHQVAIVLMGLAGV